MRGQGGGCDGVGKWRATQPPLVDANPHPSTPGKDASAEAGNGRFDSTIRYFDMAKHKWDYSKYGTDPRDMLVYGRRICTVCGLVHRKHQKQYWMRVVGYQWDDDGRGKCPGRPHRWGGAGYLCYDCGGIKDTKTAGPTCPGPSKPKRKK